MSQFLNLKIKTSECRTYFRFLQVVYKLQLGYGILILDTQFVVDEEMKVKIAIVEIFL